MSVRPYDHIRVRGTQRTDDLPGIWLPRRSEARGVECCNRRINVMQITWSFVAGGAEMYAFKIASGLNSSRYNTAMCAIDQGGALEGEIEKSGIPKRVMDRRPGIDLGLMWRMFKLFQRMKVDVIHTHHFNQLFYSILGAKLTGAKIIHTEHSVEAYKKRRLRVALRLLSLFCHKVTAIGSDGEAVLRDKVGIPQRKLQVIRAGVDVDAFNVDRSTARRELGLKDDDRVAAIIARLYPEKNHRLLLSAFADVVKGCAKAKLLVAGEGVERRAIEQEIDQLGLKDHVLMLGVRRDVARLLAASDVFVLCSDREGLPIAVLEAMAAGKPVIATAVGDLPKVVRDGETGLVIPAKDKVGLAKAMLRIFGNAKEAEQMGRRGRELVQERFSMARMIQQHAQLYGKP